MKYAVKLIVAEGPLPFYAEVEAADQAAAIDLANGLLEEKLGKSFPVTCEYAEEAD